MYLSLLIFAILLIDIVDKVFITKTPARVFWYSTIGLAFTGLAVLTENSFIVTVALCLLLLPEGLWTLGFVLYTLSHGHFLNLPSYAFSLDFRNFSSFITVYHLLFIPSLIFALYKAKKISAFGWIGAAVFALIVGILAYALNKNPDNINCIYSVKNCLNTVSPLYRIPNPERIVVAVVLLTLLIYLPTNLILLKLKK